MLLKDALKPVLMQTVEVRFNSEKCCMPNNKVIVIFQNKYFRITAQNHLFISALSDSVSAHLSL